MIVYNSVIHTHNTRGGNMTKKVVGIRVGERTEHQIEDLARAYGTITTALTIAIDRLWEQLEHNESESKPETILREDCNNG